MLFEKTTYQDDFPMNITIAAIDDYPIHYHQDIEFVVVLEGSVMLKNGYCNYRLKEGDIFTNSGHEVHAISKTEEKNIVAVIQISTRYFSQYFPSLSKSCYRTYSTKPSDERQDNLKKKILQILLLYTKKSFNYKSECIYSMVDIIDYLERHYNLFSFEDKVVIYSEGDNPVNMERMSHIIGYIYQYHSQKITLDDLAEMEHLSPFYLSHLIKDCTGMSFRDFLCFARVEWSEIYLLEGNAKISKVARDVGFSTTQYYEKYFEKWFGHSPLEHRRIFLPLVKSDSHLEKMHLIPLSDSIVLIKSRLSSFTSQEISTSQIDSIKLDINVNCKAQTLYHIEHCLNVEITYDDYLVMGPGLFSDLNELNAKRVSILVSKDDSDKDIKRLESFLLAMNYIVETVPYEKAVHMIDTTKVYGRDSIASYIYVIDKLFFTKEKWVNVRLRDFDDGSNEILKGQKSLITTNLIKKPAFYAYKLLSYIFGDVISWGKNYCVIHCGDEINGSYIIIAINFNESIHRAFNQSVTPYEANDILNEFKDETECNFVMDLEPGKYSVLHYTISREDNIFNYLASMNFPRSLELKNARMINSRPQFQMYSENVKTSFNLHFSLRGPEIQLAVVSPLREQSAY